MECSVLVITTQTAPGGFTGKDVLGCGFVSPTREVLDGGIGRTIPPDGQGV